MINSAVHINLKKRKEMEIKLSVLSKFFNLISFSAWSNWSKTESMQGIEAKSAKSSPNRNKLFFLRGKSGSDLEQWCKRYERWTCSFLEYQCIVRKIGVKNRNIYHPETACLTDIFLNSPNLLTSGCVAARWENSMQPWVT